MRWSWILMFACGPTTASPREPLKDGDIVLHASQSAQSEALRQATGSRWTHTGLVFRRNGAWQVLEAVQPVRWTPLQDWVARGRDAEIVVLRPKVAVDVAVVRQAAEAHLGKPYDSLFRWDDDRIYCSELVTKAYAAVDVQLGTLAPIRSFDLTHPAVQALLKRRTGGVIDPDQRMVAPASYLMDQDLMVISGPENLTDR